MHIKEDFFKSWKMGKEAMQRSLEKNPCQLGGEGKRRRGGGDFNELIFLSPPPPTGKNSGTFFVNRLQVGGEYSSFSGVGDNTRFDTSFPASCIFCLIFCFPPLIK